MASFRGRLSFCSNFYAAETVYDGETYPTSEHAFQAAKTLDVGERNMIKCCDTPAGSKRLGRSVTLRSDWDEVKLVVMLECLRSKFSNPDLANKLLETGDEELVEVNEWKDTYWGECPKGNGQNMLGKLLMKVREELRNV